jgi:hypothetical protein
MILGKRTGGVERMSPQELDKLQAVSLKCLQAYPLLRSCGVTLLRAQWCQRYMRSQSTLRLVPDACDHHGVRPPWPDACDHQLGMMRATKSPCVRPSATTMAKLRISVSVAAVTTRASLQRNGQRSGDHGWW